MEGILTYLHTMGLRKFGNLREFMVKSGLQLYAPRHKPKAPRLIYASRQCIFYTVEGSPMRRTLELAQFCFKLAPFLQHDLLLLNFSPLNENELFEHDQ